MVSNACYGSHSGIARSFTRIHCTAHSYATQLLHTKSKQRVTTDVMWHECKIAECGRPMLHYDYHLYHHQKWHNQTDWNQVTWPAIYPFHTTPLTSCEGGRHNMPRSLQVDLWWPFDLESGVRVTCDVGYLCANFSLPRPLCSRLRRDVRDRRHTSSDRQTSDAHHRLMPPTLGGGIIMTAKN